MVYCIARLPMTLRDLQAFTNAFLYSWQHKWHRELHRHSVLQAYRRWSEV